MSPPRRVLISGAGIAGPVVAFWLAKAGIKCTIIERAPGIRIGGQQIDIRGVALEVVKRMGLNETIRSRTVKEEGLAFVDTNGRRIAEFPARADGMSFTAEVEIQRGDLANVFYDASKETAEEYVFGDYVVDVQERENAVRVTLASGKEQEYDLVIAADGMRSKIRGLVFPDEEDPIKSLGQYSAFFSIPFLEKDGSWGEWFNAPGGRCILMRPDKPTGLTRAYISIMNPKVAGYEKLSVEEQKKLMYDLFVGAGWVSERILEGLQNCDDFYMQEIAQVKMKHWYSSKGRVVVLGDAAYCPSPISGQGTSMAIIGAYILAGEIANNPENLKQALVAYEEKTKVYVDKAQSLLPGAPALANPQTRLGISILNGVLGFVSWSGLVSLIGRFATAPAAEDKSFPNYSF